jgi:hypothetical protein
MPQLFGRRLPAVRGIVARAKKTHDYGSAFLGVLFDEDWLMVSW